MQTEICKEKEDQASFVVHKGALTLNNTDNSSRTEACNVSQTILLSQKPEETVDLQFSLSYSENYNYNYEYDELDFEYNFALTFKNNLHDVSNDYGYEIEFYQHVQDNKDSSSHTLLFSEKHIRKTNKISITKTSSYVAHQSYPEFYHKLLIDTNERHMCCRIRRYNIKTAENVGPRSTEKINIGAILFEKGLYSDFSLIVGEQCFKVHKEILSSASEVFKAMFSHDMIENKKNEVSINDFDPEIVEGLLSFIYTGETSLLTTMTIELFQVAHRYEIRSLKSKCMEYFLFIVDSKNVVDMLCNACMYDLIDLKKDLLKFIEIHEEEMVKEQRFQTFLCHDLQVETVVYTLKLCDKYGALLKNVEMETFQFIKKHNNSLISNEGFLELFSSHSSLMTRLYVFLHANE